MNAGNIVAHLKAKADEFRSGMRVAKDELNGLKRTAEDSARKMQHVGKQMTKFITLPILGIGAMAIKTAASFEGAMNKVSALSGATGESLGRLRDLAMTMGRETRYSAVEAAEGLSFLAMAGFDVEQSIAALPSVLEMAAAGGMDLAQAADYASNILTGFNMEAEEMGRVTDVLALTFTSSNTNLSQLAEGMKYAAPIAAGLGMEIEEVAAAMGMLGDAGIQGSMGGTTLRQAMVSLMSPTGKAVDVIDRLGLEVNDAEGEFVGLVDIVRQLETSGASTQDMMELFGARGAGMIALVSQGSEKFAEFVGELENAEGTGKRISDVMLEGLEGAITILRGSIETLLIVMGERFLPVLTEWAHKLVDIVNAMSNWSDSTWNIIAVLAGLLAVLGPMLMIYGKIKMMTIQYAAAKAIATAAVKANTSAVAVNTTGMVTNMGAMGKAGVKVGLLGKKLGALAAGSGPLLAVAAVLGIAAAYWSEYTRAMGADYRTFADVVQDTHSEMTLSIVENHLAGLDSQVAAQQASIASRIEYLQEKERLSRDEEAELIGLYEELEAIERQAEAERQAWRLIAEKEFGEAVKKAKAINAEEIVEQFDGLKADYMAEVEAWHGEELAAIVAHHTEMGTVGTEAFYEDLDRQGELFGERLELVHVLLGNELEAYKEQLAAIGLVYDAELGKLIPVTEKHLRDQGKEVTEHFTEFKKEYGDFGRGSWTEFNKGQRDKEKEVFQTAQEIGEGAIRGMRNPKEGPIDDVAEDIGEDTAEGLSRGMRNKQDDVNTSGVSLGEGLVAAIKSFLGMRSPSRLFEGIGMGIVQGLINGIRSMLGSLIGAAVDVVRNAYESAKNWLDSRSPSRKTMELGADWSEGIAIGITGGADMVRKAVQGIADISLNIGSQDAMQGRHSSGSMIESAPAMPQAKSEVHVHVGQLITDRQTYKQLARKISEAMKEDHRRTVEGSAY